MLKKISIVLGCAVLLVGLASVTYQATHDGFLVAQADTVPACTSGTLSAVQAQNEIKAGKIVITLQTSGLTTTSTIVNNSSCTLPASQISYSVFDQQLSTQEFFDGTNVVSIPAHTSATLHTSLPSCISQTDVYYGAGPHSFTTDPAPITLGYTMNMNNGSTYSNASGNFCTHTPPPTVTPPAANSFCSATTPNVTISWTDPTSTAGSQGYNVIISNNGNFNGPRWYEFVSSGTHSITVQNFNNFTPASGASGTLSFTPGSSYLVRIYYGSLNQFTSGTAFTITTQCQPVQNNLTATCSANPTSANVGDTVTFSATANGGSGLYTYSWTGTDGISGNSQTISKQFSNAGTKTATVVVSDGSHTYQATCNTTIVQPQSTLDGYCSTSPASANINDTVSWISHPTGGSGNYTYSWSGTDGLSGNSNTVSKQYGTSGTKNGSVVISDGQTSIIRTCSMVVNQPQQNNLTASCTANPSTANINDTVTFSATANGGSGLYTYSWTGTDGISGNSQTVSRQFGTSGTKTATVIVSDGSQTYQATCNTNINQQVYNTLNGSCWASTSGANVGQTVTFNATASGGNGNYTYSWSGNNISGYGQSVSAVYYNQGNQYATVVISDGQTSITRTCNTNVIQQVQNNISASCSANQNSAIVGSTINWYATVYGNNNYNNNYNGNYNNGYANYSWSGTDGLSGSSQNATYTYNTPGQKTATVSVWQNGQYVTATCNIYISAPVTVITTQVPPPTGNVYLSQVPYTGFADNTKVTLFVLGLFVWSGGMSYLLIRRKAKKDGKTFSQVLTNLNPASKLSLQTAGVASFIAPTTPVVPNETHVTNALESHARVLKTVVSADGLQKIAEYAGHDTNEALGTLEQLVMRYEGMKKHVDEWTVLTTEKIEKAFAA